jgi:hypothetical protein
MQNIVRDKRIKHQFTVENEHNVFVHADYKQAEGRVITTLAHDEYLRSIFLDETRDIFDELCNDIYGVGKWVKENRVSMKSIFYGNAYGRGVNAIALELQQQGSSITVEETRTLMRGKHRSSIRFFRVKISPRLLGVRDHSGLSQSKTNPKSSTKLSASYHNQLPQISASPLLFNFNRDYKDSPPPDSPSTTPSSLNVKKSTSRKWNLLLVKRWLRPD